MNRFLGLLLSGLLLGASAAAQQNSNSMKGLPGVHVLIEDLGKAEGVGGLFERDIQTDVELALRIAGIKVLTLQEQLEHTAYPSLYVRVSALIGDDGLVAYSVNVQLTQEVTLWNGERSIGATTWFAGYLGTVGRSNLWQVREDVKTYTNRFANDWLKANPK